MRSHFPEFRGDFPKDAALGFNDPHGPNDIAGVVEGNREIILGRIQLELSAAYDLIQQDQRGLSRNI